MYANEIDIEGLAATASVHMKGSVKGGDEISLRLEKGSYDLKYDPRAGGE